MATRNREREPTERKRAELRAQGKCIDCGKPSKTYRCPTCRKEADANVTRYHGQGRPGRVSLVAANMSDMRYAVEALTKAWRGHVEVDDLGPIAPRRRDELLAEPIAQVHLCLKFCREVLVRVGYFKAERERTKAHAPARENTAGHRARRSGADPRQLTFSW